MKKVLFLAFVAAGLLFTSCMKTNDFDYAGEQKKINEQYSKDSVLMSSFILEKGIDTSGMRSGVLYEIIEPGTGEEIKFYTTSKLTVNYEGRLLDGTVFDKIDKEGGQLLGSPLGSLIGGWQIGVPLLKKGGKIRLIIPSYYGYGVKGSGTIPPNSVLDFTIELIDVQ